MLFAFLAKLFTQGFKINIAIRNNYNILRIFYIKNKRYIFLLGATDFVENKRMIITQRSATN